MKWPRWFHALGNPKTLYLWSGRLIPVLSVITLGFLSLGLVQGLFYAPADYQQQDAFRIIYVHVPAAIFSLFVYSVMFMMAIITLVWRVKIADMIAVSSAPVGLLFTALALLTGAIWGKPMWGTWWVWDARLTAELILLFLYMAYLGLRTAIPDERVISKVCALLAIVGFLDVPIVHYSVNWWHTLHQGATISQFAKPSIDPSMLWPLLYMIVGFLGFYLTTMLMRLRIEILSRERDTRWVRKIMLGVA